jgi:hypothetical protein
VFIACSTQALKQVVSSVSILLVLSSMGFCVLQMSAIKNGKGVLVLLT